MNDLTLGAWLKKTRNKFGFSQLRVALAIGVCQRTLSLIENEHHIPADPLANQLALVLELDAKLVIQMCERQRGL